MALSQVKKMYQTLRNYFTVIENDFGHMDEFGPYPYASIFGGETCKFAYYMAAADGRLDERERLYINEITGYAESVQGMIDSMKQSGVVMSDDREGFAQTPFKCLVIALLADSVYQEAGKDSQILKLALTFFVLLGTDLMSVDGQISPAEQISLQSIVDTMQSVAQEAYAGSQPEESKEDPADTPSDVAEDNSAVAPEETSSEAPAETAEDSPFEAAAETAEDASSGAPSEAAEDSSSGAPNEAAKDASSEAPSEAAEDASSGAPNETTEDSSSEVPAVIAEETSSEAPADDSGYANAPIFMSVEEIVAEVNAPEKCVSVPQGLELSIGESGASYIAFQLSPAMRALICPELSDNDVPLLLVGNTICASYENQIVKKHLLKGTCTTREMAPEAVTSINRSISSIAEANTVKIEGNENLKEVIHDMLDLSNDSSHVNSLNDHLENQKSHLRIVQRDNGEYAVSDTQQFNHSLEEVPWILSF